ncbi:hypothetical protein K435DRAFT_839217 [Dendrothele bispora CBS 962.96]|uniref:Family A G protein-coupled receptor-like protein n=1 Tax=Dendrothele bispora (strain CBS 962.96) TaxID=1314807 RepID=A0A4S8M2W8_DENBC|nr:hypothetical protein K435DRAFT_839217 [Dendrothele bispora CBS 962.96]
MPELSLRAQQSQPLSDFDLLIVKGWIALTAVGCWLYGIYVTLSLFAFYSFFTKRVFQLKVRIGLFLITLITLLTATASMILNTQFIFLDISSFSFNANPDLTSLLVKVDIAINLLERIHFIISDAIVVWRAWMLFPQHTTVKIILICCMIGSCTGTFLNAGLLSRKILQDPNFDGGKIEILMMTLPLLITNVTATFLIGYKAWTYFWTIRARFLFRNTTSSIKIQKFLLLLIESGFIYCILWIIYTIITLLEGQNSIAFQIYAIAMPLLSAIYPILIILITVSENSKDVPLEMDSRSVGYRNSFELIRRYQ